LKQAKETKRRGERRGTLKVQMPEILWCFQKFENTCILNENIVVCCDEDKKEERNQCFKETNNLKNNNNNNNKKKKQTG
jgi:hypothetical protein